MAFLQAKKPEQARAALADALRLDPNRWEGPYCSGAIAAENGQWDTAISQLRKAIETNPQYAASHLLLGRILRLRKQLKESREEFRCALLCGLSGQEARSTQRSILVLNGHLANK